MSITQVNYIKEEKALQITTRLFIDDIENALNQRYGINAALKTKKETKELDAYLKKYFLHHFSVDINNQKVTYNFLGHAYEDDVVKCYLEIENISPKTFTSIAIKNTLLFDMFSEQQNLVHIKVGEDPESFILTDGNDKAMLKI